MSMGISEQISLIDFVKTHHVDRSKICLTPMVIRRQGLGYSFPLGSGFRANPAVIKDGQIVRVDFTKSLEISTGIFCRWNPEIPQELQFAYTRGTPDQIPQAYVDLIALPEARSGNAWAFYFELSSQPQN